MGWFSVAGCAASLLAAPFGGLMPIHVKLDDLLHERRMTLTELDERVGITLAIRFSTLEAICRELACQPGDLLEYAGDGVAQGLPNEATHRSASC